MFSTVRGLVETDHGGGGTCAAGWRSARCCRDGGVEHGGVAASHSQVGLHQCRRESVAQLLPRRPTVGGLEDATPCRIERATFNEGLLLLPQRGVDRVGMARVDADVVGAGVFVLVEHLLEVLAAVGRAKDSAFGIRTVRMAERGDEEPVGVRGVHVDHGDHLAVAKTEVHPGLASISGFVDTVTHGEIRSDDAGARADVDDVRVGGGDRDRADRTGWLVVEQRYPSRTVISRAPHAAVIEPDVEEIGLAGYAGQRPGAPRAGGPDLPPVHRGKHGGRLRPLGRDGGGSSGDKHHTASNAGDKRARAATRRHRQHPSLQGWGILTREPRAQDVSRAPDRSAV